MIRRTAALLLLALAAPAPAATIDSVWRQETIDAFAALPPDQRALNLPEYRVYSAAGPLLLRQVGWTEGDTAAPLDAAGATTPPIAGPPLQTVIGGLQTRGGAALSIGHPRFVIVEYWATWCVACKALAPELDAWVARQPKGTVTLVRAEIDFAASPEPAATAPDDAEPSTDAGLGTG